MAQSTLSNTLRAVLHGRQFFVYANEEQLRHAQSVAMDLLQAIVDRFGSLRAAFSKLDTSGSGWVPLAVRRNTCNSQADNNTHTTVTLPSLAGSHALPASDACCTVLHGCVPFVARLAPHAGWLNRVRCARRCHRKQSKHVDTRWYLSLMLQRLC